MTEYDWTPPNLRYYRVEKVWFGWSLYKGGEVWKLDTPYSRHWSQASAKRAGEKWVADGADERKASVD